MALIVNTIGSAGGRDYSTLAAWEAALPANLVTAGNSYEGDCYNDSEFTGTATLLTLSGHTTDASHTITLTTGAGQSFRDNASVQTNALRYNASNGVGLRITGTAGYYPVIIIDDANVFVSKIQINNASPIGRGAINSEASASATVDDCIMTTLATFYVIVMQGGQTLRNSLLYITSSSAPPGIVAGGINIGHGGPSTYFCTIVGPSDLAAPPTVAFNCFYLTATVENCAIFGCTAIKGGTSTFTFTNCMSDVASPPSGVTGGKTYANQFQNTTTASGDWREKTGADLQGAGTADSTNGAFDIAGTARPQGSNWDIGCWELVAGGTNVSFIAVSATGAVGGFLPSLGAAFAAAMASGASTTFTPSHSSALSAISATSGIAGLTPSISKTFAGGSSTGLAASFVASLSRMLGAASVSGAVAAMTPDVLFALLSGIGMGAVEPFSFSGGINVSLASASGVGTVAAMVSSIANSLSFISAVGTAEPFSFSGSKNVSIIAATGIGATGSFSASLSKALGGAASSGTVAALVPDIFRSLIGASSTSGVNALVSNVSAILLGEAGLGTAGVFSFSGGKNVSLSAVSTLASVGLFAELATVALNAVSSNSAAAPFAVTEATTIGHAAALGAVAALTPGTAGLLIPVSAAGAARPFGESLSLGLMPVSAHGVAASFLSGILASVSAMGVATDLTILIVPLPSVGIGRLLISPGKIRILRSF